MEISCKKCKFYSKPKPFSGENHYAHGGMPAKCSCLEGEEPMTISDSDLTGYCPFYKRAWWRIF